jgi:outer membrane receptor protein involved in Fe transport
MNKNLTPLLNERLRQWLLLGSFSALHAAHGQTAPVVTPPPKDPEETIVLSPFVVTTSENTGYYATNTLAGTRLRTELRDLGNAISVVTKEFMDDVNAGDVSDLLVYTAGTEVGGVEGNFLGMNTNSADATSAEIYAPPQNFTRVRGLAAADITRGDYFRTSIPIDSYNTERVEIIRGSNSILFGLGSPAGIINNSLKQARLDRNRGELMFQLDQFGTTRQQLDYNAALLKGQLGLRLNLLNEDTRFKQDFTFERDRRVHLAGNWQPDFALFRNSAVLDRPTIRVHAELGELESNRPRTTPPGDAISSFFDSRKLNKRTFDPRVTGFASLAGSSTGYAAEPGRWWWHMGYVYEQHDSSTQGVTGRPYSIMWARPGPAVGTVNGVVQPSLFGSTMDVYAMGRLPADLRLQLYGADINGTRTDVSSFWKKQDILDASVFNFYEQTLEGPNKHLAEKFHDLGITLDQTFLDQTFGVQYALNVQSYGLDGFSFSSVERGDEIYIDVNTHLQDGTPNPNVGRPFFTGRFVGNRRSSDTESVVHRGTAFAQLDFLKVMKESRLARWLGQHTFSAVGEKSVTDVDYIDWSSAIADPRNANLRTTTGIGTTDRRNAQNEITTVSYLGPSLISRTSAAGANIPGLAADQLTPTTGLSASVLNPATLQWETQTSFDVLRDIPRDASLRRTDIESRALAWQGKTLDRHLVLTAGWRRDRLKSYFKQARDLDGDNMQDPTDPQYFINTAQPTSVFTGETVSTGAVAHLPRRLAEKLPLRARLSLHAAMSENFSPTGTRVDFRNAEIDAPTGETQEFGFTVSLLDEKLVARVNWFETRQDNAVSSLPINTFYLLGFEGNVMTAINRGENTSLAEVNNYLTQGGRNTSNALPSTFVLGAQQVPVANLRAALPFGLWDTAGFSVDATGVVRANGIPNFAQIEDFVSEGLEAEIVYNPLPNWRMMLNVAKQESVRTNIGRGLGELVESRWATWQTTGSVRESGGSEPARDRFRRDLYNPWITSQALSGSVAPELRKWRVNFITNYEFTAGRLKGFGVGGAARWQDKAAIGFPITRDATTGGLREDITRPYYGPTELNWDFWTSYTTKILRDKVGLKVQLNVKNALTGDETIPVLAQPDGSIAAVRIADPRRITLSTTFSF